MGNIIIPKHTAETVYFDATLEVLQMESSWVLMQDFTDELYQRLVQIGKETKRNHDNTHYTKCAQLPMYFGFVDRKIERGKTFIRINSRGREFYKAIEGGNRGKFLQMIVESIETGRFGELNMGVPSSRSDVDPPALFIRGCYDLDGLSTKEFAFLIWSLVDRNDDYTGSINAIKEYRLKESWDIPKEAHLYKDCKPIMLLQRWGFLSMSPNGMIVSPDVDAKYQKRLKNLKIYSVDRNPSDYTSQESAKVKFLENCSIQLITYGAPGTGKSHGVEEVVGSYENTVRTTFHPDSDYSTFVGCYKPTMEAKPKYGPQGLPIKVNGVELTEDIISYSYVPQAFTKAYVRAWKSLTPDSEGKVSPQFLVIEEINRGNCAQIFGDLFQLLDRDDGGYSKYAIEADSDLARHISKELANAEGDIPENIRKGTILRLPPNLYIWATMNTSDQSLFPMDSAFKRRWEWRYVPIRDAGKNWKIVSDKYDWWEFIKKINGLISSATNSEDKQLGYFFVRPDDASGNVISASRFVNKVLFYLYNDVFKDYDLPRAFSKQEGGRFAFGDFFLDNGEADEDAVNELLSGIFGE